MKNRLLFGAWILLVLFSISFIIMHSQSTTTDTNISEILSISVTDSQKSLDFLDQYPSLQSVDMNGFSDYAQIINYQNEHPNIQISYQVSIGNSTYPHNTTQLTFDAGTFDFDQLFTNLKYLPGVNQISFPKTDLTLEQIELLQTQYPWIAVDYTVVLNDTELSTDTVSLDLSHMDVKQISQNTEKIKLLSGLKEVNLIDENNNSKLTVADVKDLQDTFPEVFFHYSFELFGKTVATTDETIEYNEIPIGNEGEADIRAALDILTNCTYFKLDDCGLDNEVMDGIRKDYPDVKVVWRVHIEPFSMLTDETMLRLTFHLNDSNVENLKYFHDVTYLDVGHNTTLTDISFVQYMPKLECVIVSGSQVSDISYFENCKELIWLELCFCYYVEDLSVLTDHPTLKYLNVSFSKVSDLTPLKNVKLERLNCMETHVGHEQRTAFEESHPNCISVFTGKQPYGYGWRYNDYGYTFFEYYANMRVVFRYGELNYWGNHKED